MRKNGFYVLAVAACVCGWIWIGLSEVCCNINICLFRHITGIPCPACGSTRTACFLLEGNLEKAAEGNFLGFLCLLALIVVPLWLLADMLYQKNTLYRCYKRVESALQHKSFFILCVVLIVANWLWMLSKCY